MTRTNRLELAICTFLVVATFAVYWQLSGHSFVNIDDNVYVTNNPFVKEGLKKESIIWAFTTTKAEFWHPVTWLSYMIDSQVFGVNPGGYLFTNLLLHVLNTLLLFRIFERMTGQIWQSGFIAAMFALHPLHVESVAWVAERKDVLSTFFWMMTMLSYSWYVERTGIKRYTAVLVFFILGLMAKPMLVTLPFVLLLMDYWPFCRFKFRQLCYGNNSRKNLFNFHLVLEKIPLFIIAAATSIAAFLVQQSEGGLVSQDLCPFNDRIANVFVSYAAYIWKMIWPQNLAVFYPYPSKLSVWQVLGSLFLLAAISVLAIRSAKRYPYFITGWLWYLGTLVPVIGIVKIGDFAMADRYTYVSLIGLFIIIAWGGADLFKEWRYKAMGFGAIAMVIISILSVFTWLQIQHWANSITLFKHTINVTENNYFAHYGMGHALASQGKLKEAVEHFEEAVRIKPDKATLYNDLGRALAGQGEFKESTSVFLRAVRMKPYYPNAHYNLGIAMVAQGMYNGAVEHFSEALRLNPNFIIVQNNTEKNKLTGHFKQGNMHETRGELNKAIEQYKKVLSIQPEFLPALRKLAKVYTAEGEYDKALSLYKIEKSTDWLKKAVIKGYDGWVLIKIRKCFAN